MALFIRFTQKDVVQGREYFVYANLDQISKAIYDATERSLSLHFIDGTMTTLYGDEADAATHTMGLASDPKPRKPQ